MSMSRRFVTMWLIIVGYVIVSIVLVVLPFVLRSDDSPTAIVENSVLAVLGVGIASLMLGILLYHNWSPSVLRETRAQGVSATATVAEVSATGWRVRGNAAGKGWRVQQGGLVRRSAYHQHEYKMRVEVRRPDMPPYEAVIFQALTEDQVPKVGDVIMVKVHPRRADIVVIPEKSD